MMNAPLTRVALSTGVELDVLDVGPRDGEVLIFLHGFPESHRTWRHQIAHFSGRYRCIAPDQRGYRGSSKPTEVSAYTPDKLAADIFALADALAISHFTIVGHDWGGAIGWAVALFGQEGGPNPAWSGRVKRAVIANAPHPHIFQHLLYSDPEQRAASQYMRAFRDPANDPLIRDKGLIGLFLQEMKWASSPAMEAEERAALMADWQDRDACFAMLNWYRASPIIIPTRDEPYTTDPLNSAAFPRLSLPTLVIWAMNDLALPARNLDGMDSLIDDLTIVKVPDCGHFVPWERPDAVNAAMDDFLGQRAG